jgi:hypothetical protein
MNVPPCAIPVLTMFRPAFSAPTYHRLVVFQIWTFADMCAMLMLSSGFFGETEKFWALAYPSL